jgi:arylsulfatase A-like enzyme
MQSRFLRAAFVVAAAALSVFGSAAAQPVAPTSPAPVRLADPPNVVLVLLDDATVYDFARMTKVKRLVADRGVTFADNYSPFPVCCPARATILTGQYAHNHGVLDNVRPQGGFSTFDDSHTVATYLDDDYRTGLFGKYLNDNREQGGYMPPGWDAYSIPDAGHVYNFVDFGMWIDGRLDESPGSNQTQVIARQAREFMTSSVNRDEPFFAYVSVVAPHAGRPRDDYPDDPATSTWVPRKYRSTAPRELPDDPSINEADVSDKPQAIQNAPLLTDHQLRTNAERSAQRVEAVQGVDAEIRKIVDNLRELGELDNTYIVVTSDNGYVLGQHRKVLGKEVPYEPSSRVPLAIRGPGLPAGKVYHRVTGLQDLAPTILAMTKQTRDQPTDVMDGMSLLGLVNNDRRPSKRVQLIEIPVTAGLSDEEVQAGERPSKAERRDLRTLEWQWRGFVTSKGLKYVETVRTGEQELYNLDRDPFELENLAADGRHDELVARMAARLSSVEDCSGARCRRAPTG